MLTGCLLGVNGMLDDKAQGICFVKNEKYFSDVAFFNDIVCALFH